jgi:hypothetical protein
MTSKPAITVVISLLDAVGNMAIQDHSTNISLSIHSSSVRLQQGALHGTLMRTCTSGQVVFHALSINSSCFNYILKAQSFRHNLEGFSETFNVLNTLAVLIQPQNIPAAQTFAMVVRTEAELAYPADREMDPADIRISGYPDIHTDTDIHTNRRIVSWIRRISGYPDIRISIRIRICQLWSVERIFTKNTGQIFDPPPSYVPTHRTPSENLL